MMQFFILLLAPVVLAAPILDPATLLSNVQKADALNKQFLTLKETDPCSPGDIACIGGKYAECSTSRTWTTTSCPSGTVCLAIPLFSQVGATTSCTRQLAPNPDDDGDQCDAGPSSVASASTMTQTPSFTNTISSSVTAPTTAPPAQLFTSTVSIGIGGDFPSETDSPSSTLPTAPLPTQINTDATPTLPPAETGTVPESTKASSTILSPTPSDLTPTTPPAFLLQNALDAQRENLRAKGLQANAPCSRPGNVTCISGQMATCTGGLWVLSQCPQNTCFNLPRTDKAGITAACATLSDALSLFKAAGATGGIDGQSPA